MVVVAGGWGEAASLVRYAADLTAGEGGGGKAAENGVGRQPR